MGRYKVGVVGGGRVQIVDGANVRAVADTKLAAEQLMQEMIRGDQRVLNAQLQEAFLDAVMGEDGWYYWMARVYGPLDAFFEELDAAGAVVIGVFEGVPAHTGVVKHVYIRHHRRPSGDCESVVAWSNRFLAQLIWDQLVDCYRWWHEEAVTDARPVIPGKDGG